MANYVILAKFTSQGIQHIKEGPKRRAAAREAATKLGATIKDVYVTMGEYDLVFFVDAADDETVAKLVLGLGMQGNLSTETLRAFSEAEFDKILESL
jgi:uncharacterized protein with GYD domain